MADKNEKKELTPEEMKALIATLEAEKAESAEKQAELEKQLKASKAEVKAKKDAEKPVTFTIEGKNKKENKEYEFTCPSFTWDDGTVYNVRDLEKNDPELFDVICAKLVQRKSGVIALKGE